MSNQLNVSQVCYDLGDKSILSQINFVVESGEFFRICGRNGCGKSTCLRLLAGLLDVQEGHIEYPSQEGFANLIGYLGHQNCLDYNLTAIENFQFDLSSVFSSSENEIIAYLGTWGIDRSNCHKPVALFSAGQKKRLALALLKAKRAKIWLLDEPKINLDREGCELLDKAIAEHLVNHGLVLMTQHDNPVSGKYYCLSK